MSRVPAKNFFREQHTAAHKKEGRRVKGFFLLVGSCSFEVHGTRGGDAVGGDGSGRDGARGGWPRWSRALDVGEGRPWALSVGSGRWYSEGSGEDSGSPRRGCHRSFRSGVVGSFIIRQQTDEDACDTGLIIRLLSSSFRRGRRFRHVVVPMHLLPARHPTFPSSHSFRMHRQLPRHDLLPDFNGLEPSPLPIASSFLLPHHLTMPFDLQLLRLRVTSHWYRHLHRTHDAVVLLVTPVVGFHFRDLTGPSSPWSGERSRGLRAWSALVVGAAPQRRLSRRYFGFVPREKNGSFEPRWAESERYIEYFMSQRFRTSPTRARVRYMVPFFTSNNSTVAFQYVRKKIRAKGTKKSNSSGVTRRLGDGPSSSRQHQPRIFCSTPRSIFLPSFI